MLSPTKQNKTINHRPEVTEYGSMGGTAPGNSTLYLRAPNGQGYIKSPSVERIANSSATLAAASSPLKTSFKIHPSPLKNN